MAFSGVSRGGGAGGFSAPAVLFIFGGSSFLDRFSGLLEGFGKGGFGPTKYVILGAFSGFQLVWDLFGSGFL